MKLDVAISTYKRLQVRLVADFLVDVRPSDLEFFHDVAPRGELESGGERWEWSRHGAGVEFTRTKDGVVVDAHVGLAEVPEAIDGWRLSTYLESLGVESVDVEGRFIPSSSEPDLSMALRGYLGTLLEERRTSAGRTLLAVRGG